MPKFSEASRQVKSDLLRTVRSRLSRVDQYIPRSYLGIIGWDQIPEAVRERMEVIEEHKRWLIAHGYNDHFYPKSSVTLTNDHPLYEKVKSERDAEVQAFVDKGQQIEMDILAEHITTEEAAERVIAFSNELTERLKLGPYGSREVKPTKEYLQQALDEQLAAEAKQQAKRSRKK